MAKLHLSITHKAHRAAALLAGLLLIAVSLRAQPPQFKMQSYIEKYAKEAVHQMIAYKIPASVTLAQAIFESRNGTSELARKANNHFGIKCHVEWQGNSFIQDDDTLNECFRKYDRIEDSYTDHSLFLTTRPRYAGLFLLAITDYKAWCYGLKSMGYATYPTYAEELIKIIEQAQLYELDHSERLNSSIAMKVEKGEIIPSKYAPSGFTMSAFSKAGLLWLDERDALIRSLDIVVEEPNNITNDLAEDGIIPSRYTSTDFTLKTFSKTGLLWMDEKDVLIQSLDILMETPDQDNSDIAGN